MRRQNKSPFKTYTQCIQSYQLVIQSANPKSIGKFKKNKTKQNCSFDKGSTFNKALVGRKQMFELYFQN